MNTAGQILKRYSRVIAECIPLFVAAGLLSAFSSESMHGSFLQKMSEILTYLVIPVFVGYKSGVMCGGDIGGLAGALAAAAVIMEESAATMVLSALVGSTAGWISKKGLNQIKAWIPAGFEMLFHNLYLTGIGVISGTVTYFLVVPATTRLMIRLNDGLSVMIAKGVIPFISVIVEPLKIMFFNNWINHGVLLPLGMEQVKAGGSSILFLLETNPGPGLGILFAYMILNKEKRRTTISSVIIHALGGIHEVYFPYVLSDIKLLAAAIAGGIAGNYCFLLTGTGLVGPASPGSVVTLLMMAEKRQWGFLILGVLVSAAVTCLLSCLMMKGSQVVQLSGEEGKEQTKMKKPVNIYFVCDVGMGSSAMAGALFRRKLKGTPLEGIEVFHVSAGHIPDNAEVVVCQKDFAKTMPQVRAKCFVVENLTDMSCYEELLEWLKGGG